MNLFEDVPEFLPEERVETIFSRPRCRVERIISWGQTTPENTWYDQPEDEWVLLLQGEAVLLMERDRTGSIHKNAPEESFEEVRMKKGDSLLIKTHQRHRVTYTSKDPPCIWLCFFVG
jgi:cupin 2 domain-containing protein